MIERNGQKVIEVLPGEFQLATEQAALDLVSLSLEHGTRRLMLHAAALPADFFRLRTGLAGAVLQKFVNYSLKVAVVIPADLTLQGKFNDLVSEAQRGDFFHVYENADEAADWLTR